MTNTKYFCTVVLIVNAPTIKDGATTTERMKVFLTSDEMDNAEAAREFGEVMMHNGAVAYRVRYKNKQTDIPVLHQYVKYEPEDVTLLPVFRY